MADEFERLTALIDANDTALQNAFKRMQSGFDTAQANFNRNAAAIESRQSAMAARLAGGVSTLTKGLLAGVALAGVERFVSSTTELASSLKSASDTTKVGTDELQAWSIIAQRAHIDQGALIADLEKFGDNMGKAAVQGGPLRKLFQGMGVDLKGSVADGFYAFADAVAKAKDPQQQLALVTTGFGKGAAALTPILAQGGAALRAMVQQFRDSGNIISEQGIEKLDALGNSWDDLKRKVEVAGAGVLTGFTDQFAAFAGQIGSPEFQSNMERFGTQLANIVGLLIKLGPYLPQLVGGGIGAKIGAGIGGLFTGGSLQGRLAGGLIGGVVGAAAPAAYDMFSSHVNVESDGSTSVDRYKALTVYRDQLLAAQKQGQLTEQGEQELAQTLAVIKTLSTKNAEVMAYLANGKAGSKTGTTDYSDLLNTQVAAQQKYLTNLLYEISQQRAAVNNQATQGARSTGQEADQSRIDAIKAQDDALLSMSKGTADYYELQRKIIAEVARLDIESINSRRDADLAAIDDREKADTIAVTDRQKKQISDLKAQELPPKQLASAQVAINQAAQDEITTITKSASDQRLNITQAAALRTSAIVSKQGADVQASLEDQYQTQQNLIDVTQTLRDGIVNIGTAATTSFKSAGEAAKAMLLQLIQMGLQMEILKPLANYLFGSPGTAGGGVAGSAVTAGFSKSGGGLIGSVLSAIWPFAGGGVMTPTGPRQLKRYANGGVSNQAAIFGEAGIEAAVPLPDGRNIPVSLRMPNVSAMATRQAGSSIAFNIDARGAQMGVADQIEAKLNAAVPLILATADRQAAAAFPARMQKTSRDKF